MEKMSQIGQLGRTPGKLTGRKATTFVKLLVIFGFANTRIGYCITKDVTMKKTKARLLFKSKKV